MRKVNDEERKRGRRKEIVAAYIVVSCLRDGPRTAMPVLVPKKLIVGRSFLRPVSPFETIR